MTESATGYIILAISLASRFLVSFSLSENDKKLGKELGYNSATTNDACTNTP